ncbi:TPA: ABC transporter permease [Streptococcus agalactiae]
MAKLLRRYKPFIIAGMQELITYRVNFFLYRIGDIMGAFVTFYLWKAVFDSSDQPLIQGFNLFDMTLYIVMSFVTNLLTKSDSSFMIGEEVKDGSIIMRLLRPVHFVASYLFTEIGFRWLVFISVGLPFLIIITTLKLLLGQSFLQVCLTTLAYFLSLILAFLINFFFNICFGFSAFVFKNLWGSNLLKNSLVAFVSGSLIPLTFFPKIIAEFLSVLPFSSLIYTPVMIVIGKYNVCQMIQALLLQLFWLVVMVTLSQLIWKRVQQSHITIQGG